MLGHRSAFANFVNQLAVIGLVLLTAGLAGAQTPGASIDKLAAQASPLKLESGSTKAKASTVGSGEDATKATAESPKSETEPVKTKSDPPKAHQPTPASQPAVPLAQCPANTPTIKADVVAIPRVIMLNRVGASVPDGFIYALRSDTVGTGNNIQLRPGKRDVDELAN